VPATLVLTIFDALGKVSGTVKYFETY